jgi:4-carboxymuconolactone decarboxylase
LTLPIFQTWNSQSNILRPCSISCADKIAKGAAMDDKQRYERGMARRRKVLGNEWVDRANARKTPFNEEFQDFITRVAWGEIWTRPHYDERTRRVLVIGTMLALDKWEEFRMHVRAALTEGGFTPDDIKEIILQQAIYCGVPAANNAFKEAAEVIADVGKGK